MKKTVLLISILFSGYFSTLTQNDEAFDKEVEITGMTTDSVKIYFGIYDNEETFLNSTKAVNRGIIEVINKKGTATFQGLKKGEYAISIFHVENDNRKMDTKIFGIPKEPYGFSNNASGFLRPPKFTIDTNKTISMKVN